ncbi:MAG: BA14K family protein [Hyphomicrobiaceae bacterium]|nr:BA14K family protein [Hyphomicrobiaceae bacterium]
MKSKMLFAAGGVLLALSAAPSAAAPVSSGVAPIPAAERSDSLTSQVHGRRGGWRGRRGWGPGIGLGLGIIGGAIIANEIYRPRRGYYYDDYAYDGPYYYPDNYSGDPRRVCAQNFRSFEWSTGLYTTYSGEKRLCPYLR